MNNYEKLEAIHCLIQEVRIELNPNWQESYGELDALDNALNLVEQVRENHPQAPWNKGKEDK